MAGETEEKGPEHQRESLKPIEGANRSLRRRLNLKGEFTLALLPTLTVLAVFLLVEAFSNQRLLFASLASSAFLIYLDPEHGTNTTRTLVLSQMMAAFVGFGSLLALGPGYSAAGLAMVVAITLMIFMDAVHPPAVSTSLAFSFKAGPESNLAVFGLAVAIVVVLIGLQRLTLWLLARYA
ncbi:MAG: HPP family protein [Armatimonadetes bacterium]|nr:HPP family protein [Armatimonadota bacterium]